jgi:hypothetical protein
MRNVLDKRCRENQSTHFRSNNFFPRKFISLSDNVENFGTGRQATGDNMITRMRIACWITRATYALRSSNITGFYRATMVMRTRLSVTLHVYNLSIFL